MSISGRIHDTIEQWQAEWKVRLRGWLVDVLSIGLDAFMKVIGTSFAPKLKPVIEELEKSAELPDFLKPLLKEIKEPTGEVGALLAQSAGGALVGGAIGSLIDALFLRFSYDINKRIHPRLPNEAQMIAMWLRGNISPEDLPELLKSLGADDLTITTLKELAHIRLDPATIMNVWLRDKEGYEWLLKDLADQGVDPARIAVIKELAKIIPPLPDMVRFADFGSFDPKIIELWREFYEAPSWISEPMSLLGITNEPGRDWANKYWFSHWRQPGRYELGEIYRRGLLGTPLIGATEVGGATETGPAEELIKNAYLTQGYSSFWQGHLLELVREIPTRVDVRRWWDMRTIDEAELRSLYQRHGYFGKDLENYVIWTKVYVAFPDLMARFTKGWITLADVRSQLTALGMPADRVEEMIQMKVKPQEPVRVEDGKSLTKTEIYKGVKKEVITWGEGIELLMDLGYDEDEADYILTINVEALAGSPETFAEFKGLTTKYKIAAGREAKPMPEEIKKAADEVVRLTGEVEALERSIVEEKRGLVGEEVLPEEATKRLKSLQVKRNRAISELERAKSEYDRQLAEWRHSE